MELEATKLKGKINFKHFRAGDLVDQWSITNTITNAGVAEVAGLINEVTSGGFKWLALGDSSTAATASDTSLTNEFTTGAGSGGLVRAAATTSRQTTGVTDDTARLLHTFTATATVSVQEVGMFDTSTEDTATILGRQTFSAKNLESSDTLQVTYDIQVS